MYKLSTMTNKPQNSAFKNPNAGGGLTTFNWPSTSQNATKPTSTFGIGFGTQQNANPFGNPQPSAQNPFTNMFGQPQAQPAQAQAQSNPWGFNTTATATTTPQMQQGQQQQQWSAPFGSTPTAQPANTMWSTNTFGQQNQQQGQGQPQQTATAQPLGGFQFQPTATATQQTNQKPFGNFGFSLPQPQPQPQQQQQQPAFTNIGFGTPSPVPVQNTFGVTPAPTPTPTATPSFNFNFSPSIPATNQFQNPPQVQQQQQQQQQFQQQQQQQQNALAFGGFGNATPPFSGNPAFGYGSGQGQGQGQSQGQGPALFGQGRGLDWKCNWPQGHGGKPQGFTQRDFLGNDSVATHLRSVLHRIEPKGGRFGQIKQQMADPNLLRWDQAYVRSQLPQMSPLPQSHVVSNSNNNLTRGNRITPPGFNQILGPLSREACEEWFNRIEKVESHRPAYLWNDLEDSTSRMSLYGNALDSMRAYDVKRDAAMLRRDNFYGLFPSSSAREPPVPSRRPNTAAPAGWTQFHQKTVFPALEAERRRARDEKEFQRSLMNFRTRCSSNHVDSWEEAVRKKAASASYSLPPESKPKPGPPLLNGASSWTDLIRSRVGASSMEAGSMFRSQSKGPSRRPRPAAEFGVDMDTPGLARSQSSEDLSSALRGVKREQECRRPANVDQFDEENYEKEFDQFRPPPARKASVEKLPNLPKDVYDLSHEQDELIANTSTYTRDTLIPRVPFGRVNHNLSQAPTSNANPTATAATANDPPRVSLPQFTTSSRYRNRNETATATGLTGHGHGHGHGRAGTTLHEGHSQEDSIHTIMSPRLITLAGSTSTAGSAPLAAAGAGAGVDDAQADTNPGWDGYYDALFPPPKSSSRKSRSKRSKLKDRPKTGVRSGVVLTNPEYFCIPVIDELDERVDENGDCFVDDFKIGHVEWGNVVFNERVNVAGLNIDEILKFGRGGLTLEVSRDSPGRRHDLADCPATITYEKFERDTSVHVGKFMEHLQEQCREMGGALVNYDVDKEQLTFKITRCSKGRASESEQASPSSLPTANANANSTLIGQDPTMIAAAASM